MNNLEKIDIFLKFYARVYQQNPTCPVSTDSIYHGLKQFQYGDNQQLLEIPNINIESVQNKLAHMYTNDPRVSTIDQGYFRIIENRGNLESSEFINCIKNSVKLYVSVDQNCVFNLSVSIFEFLVQNNIISQNKVAKFMRADALVLRIDNLENAKKVIHYINSLSYQSKNNPNPFLFNQGKVSVVMDGTLSFNGIISTIMADYFYIRRYNNSLDRVSATDFINYINNEYKLEDCLNNLDYNLKNEDDQNSFMMIVDIFKKNLNGITNLETFADYQKSNVPLLEEESKEENETKGFTYFYYIIDNLVELYGIKHAHDIIENYITTNDEHYFTRTNNIRDMVKKSYTRDTLVEDMKRLGWEHFKNAFEITFIKHGSEQVYSAIYNLINNNSYDQFSNENNSRFMLMKVIPLEMLKVVLYEKLKQRGQLFNENEIFNIMIEEIEKRKEDTRKIN